MEQKVWGTREVVFSCNCVEAYHLCLWPDRDTGAPISCSWHKHSMKHNLFYVVAGNVMVEWREDGEIKRAHLFGGGHKHIEPGVVHRFVVLHPGEVMEITWAESITEDIDREDVGHVLQDWPGHGAEGVT